MLRPFANLQNGVASGKTLPWKAAIIVMIASWLFVDQ